MEKDKSFSSFKSIQTVKEVDKIVEEESCV